MATFLRQIKEKTVYFYQIRFYWVEWNLKIRFISSFNLDICIFNRGSIVCHLIEKDPTFLVYLHHRFGLFCSPESRTICILRSRDVRAISTEKKMNTIFIYRTNFQSMSLIIKWLLQGKIELNLNCLNGLWS